VPDALVQVAAVMSKGKLYVAGRAPAALELIEGTDESAAASRPTTEAAGATQPATRPVDMKWQPLAKIGNPSPALTVGLLDVRGDVGLLLSEPGKGTFLLLRSAGFDPAKRILLGGDDGIAAVAGGRIRYVYARGADREPMEQTFDLTGKPVGSPAPFAVSQSLADQRLAEVIEGLAVAGAMGGILLAWRAQGRDDGGGDDGGAGAAAGAVGGCGSARALWTRRPGWPPWRTWSSPSTSG